MSRVLWHYARALEHRLSLLNELSRLRTLGRHFPPKLWGDICRDPAKAADWVDALRFIDPEEKILLIDVGANIGGWFGEFIRFFPNIDVVAFEPTHGPFEKLKSKYSNHPQVTLHQCAISDTYSKREIYLGKSDSLSSFEEYTETVNILRRNDHTKTEEVECRTLDSFNFDKKNRTLCLKVDTQGHEKEVFVGAKTLLQQVDWCIAEVSLANEYKNQSPSFSKIASLCLEADLFPIIFQESSYAISNIPFERDVVFVKKNRLDNIFLPSLSNPSKSSFFRYHD